MQNDNRARMMRTPDPYLRERMHDLDDLANRLLRILTGQIATASRGDLPQNAIVVARNMGPAELLDYDRTKLRGVILEEGGRTSHVAIVARALGIPAIGQATGLIDLVDTGTPDHRRWRDRRGVCPALARHRAGLCREGRASMRAGRRSLPALRDTPAVTQDGVKIELNINAGLIVDLPHLHDSGADGIGLLPHRTAVHDGAAVPAARPADPALLRRFSSAAGKPGDVPHARYRRRQDRCPISGRPKEDNPAMGWRAIRMALDRPALLRLQVRALLMAGGRAATEDHVPDDRRRRGVSSRARGGRSREGARLS